jgi:membrane-bound ClpP family serine protease
MDLMMVVWLLFALFLFVTCAILLVLEIFVPSFGLLTLFSLSCLAAGVMIFFKYGTITGWIGVTWAGVIIPIVWVIAYRMFPKSRFGKQVTLGNPDREIGDAIPDSKQLEAMLGSEGTVLTPLRPVGMCNFNGKRIECVAETGYIDTESKIRVIHVEGTQLTVRLVEND